jgi:hypothetical protein
MDVVTALQAAGFEVRADGPQLSLRYRGMGMPPTLELGRLLVQAQRQKGRLLERLYGQAQEDLDAQADGWA